MLPKSLVIDKSGMLWHLYYLFYDSRLNNLDCLSPFTQKKDSPFSFKLLIFTFEELVGEVYNKLNIVWNMSCYRKLRGNEERDTNKL